MEASPVRDFPPAFRYPIESHGPTAIRKPAIPVASTPRPSGSRYGVVARSSTGGTTDDSCAHGRCRRGRRNRRRARVVSDVRGPRPLQAADRDLGLAGFGPRIPNRGRAQAEGPPRLSIVAAGITLANADRGAPAPMVEVGQVRGEIRFWSLLFGPITIENLELRDVAILLEQNAAGDGNWAIAPSDAAPEPQTGGLGGVTRDNRDRHGRQRERGLQAARDSGRVGCRLGADAARGRARTDLPPRQMVKSATFLSRSARRSRPPTAARKST